MVGSIAFFLAELGEYLQGEVVKSSWEVFANSLNPSQARGFSDCPDTPGTLRPSDTTKKVSPEEQPSMSSSHDPESLTVNHRVYFSALIHSVLLEDAVFTKSLTALMARVDCVTVLIMPLSVVRQNLEPEERDGSTTAPRSAAAEEVELMDKLAVVRGQLEIDLKSLVRRLREIDFERLGSSMDLVVTVSGETSFVPWKGGGLYELLMKLDFVELRVTDEDLHDIRIS